MSTQDPNWDSIGCDSPSSTSVSLRAFLSEAVFVGSEDVVVSRCVNRADKCQPGDVFIPSSIGPVDQHDQAEEAVRRGAVAVVAERILPVSVPQCLVADTAKVYGEVCQRLAGDPSSRMLTIGVVGTSAKTTTGLYIAAMLKRLGGAVAYYTSLGSSDSTACDRTATRPPATRKLAHWLKESDKAGAPAVVIELTPAMLRNQVEAGVEFDLLVVTGMRGGQQKGGPSGRQMRFLLKRLIDSATPHAMVIYNGDDALATHWMQSNYPDAISYGLDASEHVRAKRLGRFGGEQQLLAIAGNKLMPLTIKTPGDHVARAAMAAIATAFVFEFPIPKAIAGIEALDAIPGRMQRLQQAVEVPVYIDAGYTPDQVAVALHGLRSHQLGDATVVAELDSRIDAKHRQRLGEVLEKSAAKVVLCSSELSPEAAQAMAMDVLGGCKAPGRVHVIPDREAAIRWAVENTKQGTVLLSGRGVGIWTSRDGEPLTDEAAASVVVSEKNQKAAAANLAVFPANEPPAFFSH
ncbi:MAG: UDP-N-acetylmuramoyl-L-alanyl-D-glutamate--2,6-diaminopimelate ligase [Aureliella sp.]